MSSTKTPSTFIGVATFGSDPRSKFDQQQMKKFNSVETRFIKEKYSTCSGPLDNRTAYDLDQMKKFNTNMVNEKYQPPRTLSFDDNNNSWSYRLAYHPMV